MITKEELLGHKAPWEISEQIDEYLSSLSVIDMTRLVAQLASSRSTDKDIQPYVEQYMVHFTTTEANCIDMPVEFFYIYLKALRITMKRAEVKEVTLIFTPLRLPVRNGVRFVQYKKAIGLIAGVDMPSKQVDNWFMNHILPLGV